MNSELEAFFAAARTCPATRREDSKQRRKLREGFPERFLAAADATLKPLLESAATILQAHGYGATVALVRDQPGANPNSFPYLVLHFSPERCSPADLGYIYTLAGASVSFNCRRDDLCVEVVVAHPAGRGVERRVNFYTVALEDLGPERVNRIVSHAVKQIVKL